MSMVSLYLASRSVIEAPMCQLSATLSRHIIRGTNRPSALADFVEKTSETCLVDLPLGMGLACTSNAESKAALAELRAWNYNLSMAKTLDELNRTLLDEWHKAEGDIWRAAHCDQSNWQVQPGEGNHQLICGFEVCIDEDLPQGPTRSFNHILTLAMREKMEKSGELERSVKELLQKLIDKPGTKLLAQLFPWKAFIRLVRRSIAIGQSSAPILLKSWRLLQPRFLLGLAFLLASVQPLAEMVHGKRGLRHHKLPVVMHVGIDIIMLEITSILVLTSSFTDQLGNAMASGLDLMLATIVQAVRSFDPKKFGGKGIKDFEGVLNNAEAAEAEKLLYKVYNLALDMLQGLTKPMLVHTPLFVAFVAAALLFYSLSTILCKDNSVCRSRPWVTRWNTAVGGPLHLLGCLEEPEVRKMCQPLRLQLLLRGLLLSAIVGVFLARSDYFDAILSNALVFNIEMGRLPWFLAWFALWALHIFSGMLAINGIEENQLVRDQKQKIKDMEAAYGATAQARERPVPRKATRPLSQHCRTCHATRSPASVSSSTASPPSSPQFSERPPDSWPRLACSRPLVVSGQKEKALQGQVCQHLCVAIQEGNRSGCQARLTHGLPSQQSAQ
ncbi:unnamed protein product [Symbiodinium natans]|uniref:Uncharacterized protein n=1 Tax=Symbiodinium natans TaxID=878477 RepID=A0A812SP58_9DINO|nr:unnamed protein product [Symbiodinium natans]